MNEQRIAGTLNTDYWNSVKGTMRKWDYLNIRDYMLEEFKFQVSSKIDTLKDSVLGKVTNAGEIAMLGDMLKQLDTQESDSPIKHLLGSYEDLTFDMEAYELVSKASRYCSGLSNLYTSMKRVERGMLNTATIYVGEAHMLDWLATNKHELYVLTTETYADVLEDMKHEREAE